MFFFINAAKWIIKQRTCPVSHGLYARAKIEYHSEFCFILFLCRSCCGLNAFISTYLVSMLSITYNTYLLFILFFLTNDSDLCNIKEHMIDCIALTWHWQRMRASSSWRLLITNSVNKQASGHFGSYVVLPATTEHLGMVLNLIKNTFPSRYSNREMPCFPSMFKIKCEFTFKFSLGCPSVSSQCVS